MSNGFLVTATADLAVAEEIGNGFGLDVVEPGTVEEAAPAADALSKAANVGLLLSNAAARDEEFVALMRAAATRLPQAQLIILEPEARAAFAFLPEAWPAMSVEEALRRVQALIAQRQPAPVAEPPPPADPLPSAEPQAQAAPVEQQEVVQEATSSEAPVDAERIEDVVEAAPAAEDERAPDPEAEPAADPNMDLDLDDISPKPGTPAHIEEVRAPDPGMEADASGGSVQGETAPWSTTTESNELEPHDFRGPPIDDIAQAPGGLTDAAPDRDPFAEEAPPLEAPAEVAKPAPPQDLKIEAEPEAPPEIPAATGAAAPAPASAPSAPAPPARKRAAEHVTVNRSIGAGNEPTSAPADATAFAPKKLRRGSPELVRVVMHQPRDLAAVIKAARKIDPRTAPAPQAMGIGDVAFGAEVGVSLEVSGGACDGTLQRRTWSGAPIDFSFSVEPDADVKQAVFVARVFINDAQIGVLAFTRPVSGPKNNPASVGDRIRLKRHKRVFLSYSSKDRETVSAIATAYQMAGVAHFWDRASLKSGEEWHPRLRREIDRADLFHLCWSKSASASEWVEKETEYALTRRQRSNGKKPDITVQMLDGPPWAPHPPHLDSINFDDFVRAAIVGYARGDGEA